MYAFNSAAIFYPGHPYIESTTVLADTYFICTALVATSAVHPDGQHMLRQQEQVHAHIFSPAGGIGCVQEGG